MRIAGNIGLLTPGWPGQKTPNGIATSVYHLAIGLRDIGRKPIILAQRIDGPCPPDIAVVPVPELDWNWREKLRARLGSGTNAHRHAARRVEAAVQEAIATHGLDILIMEETDGWSALLRTQVPIIVTLHGPWILHKSLASSGDEEDARRVEREQAGFAAAAGLIAPSQNVLDAVKKSANLSAKPKTVLFNSYAPETEFPVSAALPDRKILFVGRFDRHKGGDVVLEAFKHLTATHPDAALTFVGPDIGVLQPDGSKCRIKDALAELPQQVRQRITYTGTMGRKEIADLRQSHAIALVASRYENLNYTLLEAMAAGQAIVCTAVGGPAEVLEDGRTALMVPSEDPQAMAVALGRLLDDGALAKKLGETARAKMKKDFHPKEIAQRTADFIDATLGYRSAESAGKADLP